tara:strand:+ start:611 stop:964 length:354 start_codon:yes stop_codon:yes gene_type:complete
MALKYSQYIGGTKVDVTADSGAVPNTTKHKVSVLTSGSYETKRPNFIAKIKCVDTEAQWTNVDLYDMDGVAIGTTITLEESDEVTGPFGKVTISSSQASGSASSSITSIMIWEKEVQ